MMSADKLCPIALDATWISRALLLSGEAGWNQNAADWAVFFQTSSRCMDARSAIEFRATAAALPYGDHFGWISMVLVTTSGAGRELLPSSSQPALRFCVMPAGRLFWMRSRLGRPFMQRSASCLSAPRWRRWEGRGGEWRSLAASPGPGAGPIGVWG